MNTPRSFASRARIGAIVATLCAAGVLFASHPTLATNYFDTSGLLAGSGVNTSSPVNLALSILSTVLGLIGLIDVCIVIYGGFTILTSMGNPEKIKSGRDTVVWALIGSLIIFSSLGIVVYIGTIIGA